VDGHAILIVSITHILGHATIHLCTKFDGYGLLRLHRDLRYAEARQNVLERLMN